MRGGYARRRNRDGDNRCAPGTVKLAVGRVGWRGVEPPFSRGYRYPAEVISHAVWL